MIAALCYLWTAFSRRRAARAHNVALRRASLAWKRDRYDLNPAFRVRTRIPKVQS